MTGRLQASRAAAGRSTIRDVLRTPGQPLDTGTRAFMETRFGHDFSHVRVHADAPAAESAYTLDAAAYTVGRDTVFGAGAYAPHTASGRRLLAHELAHVMQQGDAAPAVPTRMSTPSDAAEHDADRAAADAIAGRSVSLGAPADAGTLHRQTLPGFRPQPPPRVARLTGSERLDGFALGSATLTEQHRKRLAILAVTLLDLLREYPGGVVRVTGHTDATGGDAFNERLGQKRADAVRELLIEAGVPASALATESGGEGELLVPTKRAEARNRRVAVRFDTGAGKPVLSPPDVSIPDAEPAPDLTPKDPKTPFDCSATADCSAVGGSFARLPEGLRRLLWFDDPAAWYEDLDPDNSMALRSIYNRLCRYGLLCHVQSVFRIDAGATPAKVLDVRFKVPGSTPSVFFNSTGGAELVRALLDTGRFCLAHGAGALAHTGQTTIREISGSDSLHISIGPGDQCDAHIDRYSPVPEHPGSIFCSNAPTGAAVGHIGRELVPDIVPNIVETLTGWMKHVGPLSIVHDIATEAAKGVEVLPDSTLTPTVPREPANRQDQMPPPVIGITWHGPASKPRQRRRPAVPPLPPELELLLAQELPRLVPANALTPPDAAREVARLEHAAEMAGPDEEDALGAARDAARARLEAFPDAQLLAHDMARRMADARNHGDSAIALDVGPVYDKLTPAARQRVFDEMRDIARLVRKLLDGRGGGVRKIWVIGVAHMWEVEF